MECNRDDALRAVEVAERKFAVQDYVTAKKFLLKAQQLYPALDKVSPMLAVVEVHTVAHAKASGAEIDCYQLLQVDTNADDSTIKKNYRRLALLLHPDKNKSPGAEAAFKLIGEAWAVLSDTTKRKFYDTKRMLHAKHAKVTIFPSMHTKNGHANQQQTQAHAGTFWTACPNCKMQYEYYSTYLNFNLKCQKCSKIFVARDLHAPPTNGVNTPFGWPNYDAAMRTEQPQGFRFHQNLHNVFEGTRFPGFGAATTAGMKNAGKDSDEVKKADTSAGGVKTAENIWEDVKRDSAARRTKQDVERETIKPKEQKDAMAESRKQEAIDTLIIKRKRKEEEAAARRKIVEPRSRKRLKKAAPSYEDDSNEHEKELEDVLEKLNTMVPDSHERRFDVAMDSEVRRSSRTRKNVHYNFDHSEEEDDDLVAFPRSRKRGKMDAGTAANLQKDDTSPSVVQFSGHNDSDSEPDSGDESESDDELDANDPHEIPVPDPDFHDFDGDRTEKCFSPGQVWAVYDNFDGMPRYYCRIMKVLRGDGFGVCTKWLEPLPACSGRIQGLSAACGDFIHGKQQVTKNNNQFSHVMRVEMADKNLYKIYPRCSEVWALFRDSNTSEFRSSVADQGKSWNYEIVEVLTDFSEEMGVKFVPLVKVDGYKTVFTQQVEDGLLKMNWLPAKELSRFSHMVPSWNIIGIEEDLSTSKDSWDLDPASLPVELIR